MYTRIQFITYCGPHYSSHTEILSKKVLWPTHHAILEKIQRSPSRTKQGITYSGLHYTVHNEILSNFKVIWPTHHALLEKCSVLQQGLLLVVTLTLNRSNNFICPQSYIPSSATQFLMSALIQL